MSLFRWEGRERPLLAEAEVVVVGGGLAGVAAALTAAEAGRETLLVSRRPQPGWEATAAFTLELEVVDSPLWEDLRSLLERVGGWREGLLDPPLLEITLLRVLREKGVEVLLYSTPVGLLHDERTAAGVILGHKNGLSLVTARTVVEATEEGLLWTFAGGRVTLPEAIRGQYTLFFNQVTEEPLPEAVEVPEYGPVSLQRSLWPGEVAARVTVRGRDFSDLMVAARQAVVPVVEHLRANVSALANALFTHTGYTVLPLSAARAEGEAPLGNLFGAGPWCADFDPTDLAARWKKGEETGQAAAEAVPEVPKPREIRLSPAEAAEGAVSEVLVVGGGTAGALAAIAAGQQGVETTLLEADTFLGGLGTGGGIHMYYHGLTGGLQDELDERVRALTDLFGGPERVFGFHPEAKKVALQQMADEANVTVLFDTMVCEVLQEGNRVRGVVAARPEGLLEFPAAVVVDSTGDADVAALAGAPFTLGREKDGLTHAYSQPAGCINAKGQLAFLNFDAGYCDATDVRDLTRARISSVEHYWREEGYTAENRLLYLASLLGLRQSRQIVGEYRQTLDDQVRTRRFPDAIAYIRCHYDNHAFDYENESDEALVWVWLLGHWRRFLTAEVPYRCLLPREVEGLLVACRAVSITHDAHMAFRMQRDMQRIGEAAGVAAALAAQQGITPRELDVREVQAVLAARGALREDWPPKAPSRTPEEWAAELEGEDPGLAVWHLAQAGEEAVPPLLKVLQSGSPTARFWAAAALALQGQKDGLPILLDTVRRRDETVPYNPSLKPTDNPVALRAKPRWIPTLALLGRLGDPAARPVLCEVVAEPEPDLDVLLTAIRALGRLDDVRALECLHPLREREDLPTQRVLQVSLPGVPPVVEDARWQVDLTLAEALHNLGEPPPEELIRPYLEDERAYVRRYAARIADLVGLGRERLAEAEAVEEVRVRC